MKDALCAYYTDSEEITNYMVSMIDIQDNDIILEPSAGSGLFIDELLKTNKRVHIDSIDIDKKAILVLKEKYKNNSDVIIREADTLIDNELDFFSEIGGYYSKIIGNPPYGAWQDYSKRNLLKKKYSGQYVKETYSLFLLRCISLLRNGGKLSFIIPDTFMFLNLHHKLRDFIFTQTKVLEILIFPSKFFPGVNFGYSNLSIITLERSVKSLALENSIRIITGFKKASEFSLIHNSDKSKPEYWQEFLLSQRDIYNNPQHRFILSNSKENDLITKSKKTLGDVSDIVTGFYSGDNTKFVRVKSKDVKGAKNYDVVNNATIEINSCLSGVDKDEAYIPYIKSSSKTKYVKNEDEWFVRWDKKTVEYYIENKKSRFQNSSFYFRKGICIPMVKSSIINAFYMENRVFDQSVVGIFPKDEKKMFYILALMNSDIINRIIHLINPTANNSSNYVKQIPYIEPAEEKMKEITDLVKEIVMLSKNKKYREAENIHQKVNTIFNELYAV